MEAPIISILSDSFEESVGSHAPRVILFGTIPAIIPVIHEVPISLADPIVAPNVGAVAVMTPTGVLDLVDYSSSFDSNPSEDSYVYSSSDFSSDISLGSSLDFISDSSLVHSSGSSCKRCRSPATLVPSSTLVLRLIARAVVDLLPHKRFRDSYSTEVSGEEHMEMGTIDAKTIAYLGISEGVRAHTEDGDAPDLEETVGGWSVGGYQRERAGLADRVRSLGQDNLRVRALLCIDRDHIDSLRHHMVLSQEEFCQVHRDRDDAQRKLKRLELLFKRCITMTITYFGMTPEAIEEIVNQRVKEALAASKATHADNALAAKSHSQIGIDKDNGNSGNKNGGNGNGENGNVRNGNPNENDRGVVGLIRWFEKIEAIFYVSNCPKKYQVKYATCTLLNSELTWWNSYQRTIGADVVFSMSWRPFTVRYGKCNKVGHLTRDYKATNSTTSTYRGQVVNQKVVTCYGCERQGHYSYDCPKLKDQNRRNKTRNTNRIVDARGKAYVLGRGDANPDSNVVTGTFLFNNHYTYVLFDLGVDRSFVSTTFSTLLDIILDTLDVSYVVELADGRIFETNIVLRGCTLGLLGHPFNIDLIQLYLGSFDIVIGMDWSSNHHAVIICDEKIYRFPKEMKF
nr:hypothetical protein [Tanacetum cinerariifolium]